MSTPSPMDFGSNRQKEIYINGLMGQMPIVPFNSNELERQAAKKMSPQATGYIVGGAGADDTIKENRRGFQKWRIHPRMLRNVAQRDTSVKLFGQKMPSPILTCPIGVLEMAHEEADLAVAKATSSLGIPMIFSNQASVKMEDCAAVMGDSARWFQLYWSKSNELVKSLVQRAESCGCSAIVVTLDTTLLGWRVQDLDLAFLPFLRGQGIAQYTSDPTFRKIVGSIDLGDGNKNPDPNDPMRAIQTFTSIYSRPSIIWEELSFLRECTSLPIILKGILHPADAQLALDHGVDGIIVSNHGGRQVDGSISAIEALPMVSSVIKGRIPVLMDSGIRGGADIFKAIALGANAVCIGRPYCYGLAIAGEEGVKAVLQNMMADFELTMALSGCRSISEINRECLIESR
jgi:lactate 2-monooxygenase